MDDRFVEVYSIATGRKQLVPKEWLNHPILGAGIAKTPRSKAQRAPETSTAQQ